MKKYKICKIILVILAIFYVWLFMNCSESALHIKSSRKCPIQPKRNKNGSWNECSENTERAVIIEKNPEALLQRVRLIKNAKRKLFFLLLHFNPMKVEN